MTRCIDTLGQLLSTHRRHPLARLVGDVSGRLYRAYENSNYDIGSNGELTVLRRLATCRLETLIDVGACVGEWSLAAAREMPWARVLALEVVPASFTQLVANTRAAARVEPVQIGLARSRGDAVIKFSPHNPTMATVFTPFFAGDYQEVRAAFIDGDTLLAQRGIERVDFLKIDVEGMEPQVLEGFEAAFARERIDVVQFEYGMINIDANFLLRDFHAWFERRGFRVGKIFPRHVDFRPYEFRDENFIGPNFLAVRAERTDYIALLEAS